MGEKRYINYYIDDFKIYSAEDIIQNSPTKGSITL